MTKSLYTSEAANYDQRRFSGVSGEFVRRVDGTIVRRLVARVGPKRILDVPTGTGRVLDYLHDVDVHVKGLDATPEMLREARKILNPKRQEVMEGDAKSMPFDDAEFDMVISLRFFHLFTPDQRIPFAAEFARVLRPGGYLLCSFTNGWYAGGLNWAKRFLRQPTMSFLYPSELSSLLPGWKVCALYGNFLPKQGQLSVLPGIGPLVDRPSRVWPFNRICWERFYLLQKPST